ncbi:uncharacterized mitochondrial protein AtMg00810-like [Trifolium pratense]|uniref:uncharacterized mitochondrial protein AtMg00810-like n=1 Tax=Trifolium pratense TaxID=57577 RepID=UPI001E695AE2|nr:uncharacterized mitochondrial protein AtMg00810-like [Trifolium pratense]
MTDFGKMRYFLGVEVKQCDSGIFIYQQKYAQDIILIFGMENCNKLIGSLVYLLATRPDVAFSVCLIARYMELPTKIHLITAKRVLRYLQGTLNLGILYTKSNDSELKGWTDSDYAGDIDDRKSTYGYGYMYGNGAVYWSSKKQAIVICHFIHN